MKFLSIPLMLFALTLTQSNSAQACNAGQREEAKATLEAGYTWVETNVIDKWPALAALEDSLIAALKSPSAENTTIFLGNIATTIVDAAGRAQKLIVLFTAGMTEIKGAVNTARRVTLDPKSSPDQIQRAQSNLIQAVTNHGNLIGVSPDQIPSSPDLAKANFGRRAQAFTAPSTQKGDLIALVAAITNQVNAKQQEEQAQTRASSQPFSQSLSTVRSQ